MKRTKLRGAKRSGGLGLRRAMLAAGATGNLLAMGVVTVDGAVLIGVVTLLVGCFVRPLRLLCAPALAIAAVGMLVHIDPPSTLVLLVVSWALILPRLVGLLLAWVPELIGSVAHSAVATRVQLARSHGSDRLLGARPPVKRAQRGRRQPTGHASSGPETGRVVYLDEQGRRMVAPEPEPLSAGWFHRRREAERVVEIQAYDYLHGHGIEPAKAAQMAHTIATHPFARTGAKPRRRWWLGGRYF